MSHHLYSTRPPVQPLAGHRTIHAPTFTEGSVCRVIRLPSGLQVEYFPPASKKPLWPLITSVLLIWAAILGTAAWLWWNL